MGDIADWHLECIEEEIADEQREVRGWFDAGDQAVRDEIECRGFYKSEYTKLVKSIMSNPPPYSKKQRWALALYLVKDGRT